MKYFFSFIVVCLLTVLFVPSTFADTVLEKETVDFVFSLSQDQWKQQGPTFHACTDCDVRLVETKTGTGLMVHDQVANKLVSILPNYADPKHNPIFMVIGIFFPVGWEDDYRSDNFLPAREMQAQQDISSEYTVAATAARGPSGYEGVLYTITKSHNEK
ncbi:MAG: hypothetical protein NPIRA02_24170 [Nitrospirales bacterium]|nr:MAG: hypothetical protein NPIRA02_24170 [Nitrospirales bacterium]